MTTIYCTSNPVTLGKSNSEFRVLLYGTSSNSPDGLFLGRKVYDEIRRLAVLPDQKSFDFLTIALSVIAADIFISRKYHSLSLGFARSISLKIEIGNPDPWLTEIDKLQTILNFLSGDRWQIELLPGGQAVPKRKDQKGLRKFINLSECDSVCLFSGGMDSFIGAGHAMRSGSPILVSRSPTGDQKYQSGLALLLVSQCRFAVNDAPHYGSLAEDEKESSTRARSLLFLALAVICSASIQRIKKVPAPILIPENGFIAINPPLTTRRMGANTTRTAHPYYLGSLTNLLKAMGLPAEIQNPYQFKTKGEMLEMSKTLPNVTGNICRTISCGHWHRRNIQCGRCWPCFIRRASLHHAGINDTTRYEDAVLKEILKDEKKRVDLWAVLIALKAIDDAGRNSRPYKSIRYLPQHDGEREQYLSVVDRGFEELRKFMFEEGVWPL